MKGELSVLAGGHCPVSEERNSGRTMVNAVSNGHVGDVCYMEFASKWYPRHVYQRESRQPNTLYISFLSEMLDDVTILMFLKSF